MIKNATSQKVIIIGAGAAGLMAASLLIDSDIDVAILEKNEKPGKKLYITGKGRCNFTNHTDVRGLCDAVVTNPKFMYGAFAGFTSDDVIAYFNKLGLRTKEERGRRCFPESDHSSDVIKVLYSNIVKSGVTVHFSCTVKSISYENERFEIKDANGNVYTADNVIVATGGLSYPSTGSTGDGYTFAKSFGIDVKDTYPSLVPLICIDEWIKDLEGLSLKNVTLQLKCNKKKLYEGFGEMLFTDKGISGPLALTGSAYITEALSEGAKINAYIDLKPALSHEMLEKRILREFDMSPNKSFKNVIPALFPAKLVPVMVSRVRIPADKKVNEITKKERQRLVELTKRFDLQVMQTAGYNEAVTTQGGVSVKELNPKTMESKKIKGLYFIGEVIDVDALTGGYNLQIAWSTANAAVKDIANGDW